MHRNFLARYLRVHPGEGWKVVQFSVLCALLQAGLATGMSAADSLFLANVGADKLPIVYLLTPVMMLCGLPILDRLLGRFHIDRVFDFTLGLLIAGGVFFYVALHSAPSGGSLPAGLYYAAKLYTGFWYICQYTLLWLFIDCYFALTDAKRLFGLFAAGSALGAIGGGMLVSAVSESIGVSSLFLCWTGFAVVAVPMMIWTRRSWTKLPADESAMPAEAAGESDRAPAKKNNVFRSRYVVLLTLVIALTLVTATVCEYQYMAIFSQLVDETSLAELFGKLYAFVNAFNLVVMLLVFPRLVAKLGVRNTALIQPFTFLVTFAVLYLGNSFMAGLAGFLAFQGIMTSIEFNNSNLFFNSLPSQDKNRIRGFIEGLAEPMAMGLAGLGLLFLIPRMSPESLSGLGFACALGCLVLVLMLRSEYLKVMVASVKRGWLDFTRGPETLFAHLPKEELAFIDGLARTGSSSARRSAIAVLGQNDRGRALEALLAYLVDASPEERIEARPLLSGLLAGSDSAVIQRCMMWLDEHPAVLDAALLEEFGPRRLVPEPAALFQLRSQQPVDRAAGASALWSSWRLPHSLESLHAIQNLLNGGAEEIAAGLRGLGRLGDSRYLHNVSLFFIHPSPVVRHEAIVASHQLATRDSSEIVPALLGLIEKAEGGDRLLVLETLGKIGATESLQPILARGIAYTPHERRCVEKCVLQIGLRSVPSLVAVVQDPSFPIGCRSIATRALGKLAFPQLESLAWPLIDRTIQWCYRSHGLRHTLEAVEQPGPGISMLAYLMADRPKLQLEMILEFLTVVGRLPDYESILMALHSSNSKDRDRAIETIEGACRRDIFRKLLPLIDGRSIEEQLRYGRAAGFVEPTGVAEIVAAEIQSRFDLGATIAMQAKYEIDPSGAADAMAMRLQQGGSPLLATTALQLLARRTNSETDAQATPTTVDLLHQLVQNDFFAGWGMRVLEILGPALASRSFGDGDIVFTRHEVAEGLHLILSGAAIIDNPSRRAGPGELLGEASLLGATEYDVTVRAQGVLRTVFVPAKVVRECASTYPQLALNLLRRKLAA